MWERNPHLPPRLARRHTRCVSVNREGRESKMDTKFTGIAAMVVKAGESYVLLMPRNKNRAVEVEVNGVKRKFLETVTDGVSTWSLKSPSHESCLSVAAFDDFASVNTLVRENVEGEGLVNFIAVYRVQAVEPVKGAKVVK